MVLGTAAWTLRRPALTLVGTRLIAEDPLAPSEVAAVSLAAAAAAALEAASLYRDGLIARVVLPGRMRNPLRDELEALDVQLPGPAALAVEILTRSGVPRTVITILDGEVDGTGAEMTALARWAHATHPDSLLYLLPRSHTARAGRRLRTLLPEDVRLAVRAPRTDGFRADAWWHRRGSTREVMSEYLRWTNTFLVGDLWRPRGAASGG